MAINRHKTNAEAMTLSKLPIVDRGRLVSSLPPTSTVGALYGFSVVMYHFVIPLYATGERCMGGFSSK